MDSAFLRNHIKPPGLHWTYLKQNRKKKTSNTASIAYKMKNDEDNETRSQRLLNQLQAIAIAYSHFEICEHCNDVLRNPKNAFYETYIYNSVLKCLELLFER